MNHYILIFSLLLIMPIFPIFGSVDDVYTDKSIYYEGETIIVSGTISSENTNPLVSVVALDPARLTFVSIGAPTFANSDGSFSTSITTGGNLWAINGIYPIQITSENHSLETSIEYFLFVEESTPEPTIEPEPTPEPTPESQTNTPKNLEPVSTFNTLKLTIQNFPAFDKSPQYYIDRYNDESSYQSWFDSQFPNYPITDVVGYKSTHVDNFPAFDKSPQYYIDRYNDESSYQSWFDSQFPNESIYNILGYGDPVSMPSWIRNNAEWWATGKINDSAFVSGIEFMLENNIIMVSTSSSGNISNDDIPDWIRNNAHWWSQDLISEDEFINSLEYLIREGIITIK